MLGPQKRSDPRRKLDMRERLAQELRHARLDRPDLARGRGGPRHHHDRRQAMTWIGSDDGHERQAALSRQLHVEQDEIRGTRIQLEEGLLGRDGLLDDVAGDGEQAHEQFPDLLVVVDDQQSASAGVRRPEGRVGSGRFIRGRFKADFLLFFRDDWFMAAKSCGRVIRGSESRCAFAASGGNQRTRRPSRSAGRAPTSRGGRPPRRLSREGWTAPP